MTYAIVMNPPELAFEAAVCPFSIHLQPFRLFDIGSGILTLNISFLAQILSCIVFLNGRFCHHMHVIFFVVQNSFFDSCPPALSWSFEMGNKSMQATN